MKGKNEELFNRMLSNKINKRHFYNSTNEKRNNNFIEEFDFKKTLNTLIINVDGERPLILFKKSPSPMKIKKSEILKNNYMSDGGIKKRSKKFFNLISNYSCKKQTKKESVKEKRHVLEIDAFRKAGFYVFKKLPFEYLLTGADGNVKEKIPTFMGVEHPVLEAFGEIVKIEPAVLRVFLTVKLDYLKNRNISVV